MVPGLPMLHQGFDLMRMCGKVRGLPECLVGPSHNPHHHPMPRGRSVSTCVHAQLCLTFCSPMDGSPPGSSVHGILQYSPEYWSGLPCPSPGDLPNPGIKPMSPALQADSSPTEPPGNPTPRPFLKSIL